MIMMSCGDIGANTSVGAPLLAVLWDMDQAPAIAVTPTTAAITVRIMLLRICHLLVAHGIDVLFTIREKRFAQAELEPRQLSFSSRFDIAKRNLGLGVWTS